MDTIISIDTEEMKEIARLATLIDDEAGMCVTCMKPVMEHNDWNCKERDRVNDKLDSLKKGDSQLAELSREFHKHILAFTSRFEAFEQSIPSEFAFLDQLIGAASSVVNCGVVSNATAIAVGGLKPFLDEMYNNGSVENYVVTAMPEPLNICRFEDFDI